MSHIVVVNITPQPNPELIEMLEELSSRALTGELQHLSAAITYADRTYDTIWTSGQDHPRQCGLARLLCRDIEAALDDE